MLQATTDTPISRPTGEIEARWKGNYLQVAAAEKRQDELAAARLWEELGKSYHPDDPDERGWHLLALRHAEELKKAITDRRELVVSQLANAQHAELQGNRDEAAGLRKEIRDRYGAYTDLADVFGPRPAEKPEPPATPPPTDPPALDGKSEK